MSNVYEELAESLAVNVSELKRLRTQVKELESKVSKMYTEDQHSAYGIENYNRGHAEGYHEATDDCEDFFQSRMYNLRDYIQKLNLTTTKLG